MTDEQAGTAVMNILNHLRRMVKEGSIDEDTMTTIENMVDVEMRGGGASDEPPYFPGRPSPGTANDAISAAVVRRMHALAEAQRDVGGVFANSLAFDSAESLYGAALRQIGVTTTGIHPSGFKAIWKARRQSPSTQARNTGHDSGFARHNADASRITVL